MGLQIALYMMQTIVDRNLKGARNSLYDSPRFS